MSDYVSGEHRIMKGCHITSNVTPEDFLAKQNADPEKSIEGRVNIEGRAMASEVAAETVDIKSPVALEEDGGRAVCRGGIDYILTRIGLTAAVICLVVIAVCAFRIERHLTVIKARTAKVAAYYDAASSGSGWQPVPDENIHGWLGVTVVDGNAEAGDIVFGVVVSDTISGGPADLAGIKKGDLITKINGYSTPDISLFLEKLSTTSSGETITVTTISEGASKEEEHTVRLVSEEELYSLTNTP